MRPTSGGATIAAAVAVTDILCFSAHITCIITHARNLDVVLHELNALVCRKGRWPGGNEDVEHGDSGTH